MSDHGVPIPAPLRAVARAMAVLGTLGVAALVLLVDYDIVGRQAFSQPVGGVAELAALGIVIVVFLQAPFALASDRMIRADMLVNLVKQWSGRAGAVLETVLALAGAAIFAVVAAACFPEFVKHWSNGDAYGDPQVFLLAKWPTTLTVSVGCTMLAVVYLFQSLGWARRAWRGEAGS